MATYLVLTPPGAAQKAERTLLVRDGFSLVAFLFPTLWLIFHRLWLFAVAAFLLQGIGGELVRRDGLWPAGVAILFGVSLLAGLEGRNLHAGRLAAKGWSEDGVLVAGRLAEAEDVYFADAAGGDEQSMAPVEWTVPAGPKMQRSDGGPALGLIGFDGGR
jgi:Protein of unknown function (DUF2628)